MRYLQKGMTDVGVGSTVWRGLTESMMEGKQFAKGLMPRKNYMEARAVRRPHDYITELKNKLTAAGAKYAEVKKRALDKAYLRNVIGQAGLDQPNLRMDLQQQGIKNKFYRGLEQSTRVFRALQEGIETVNRAAPICAYVEYYMDKGFAEDQAIELAINNMVMEQTGYSKANWPGWLGGPLAGSVFMFKKFAAQQGYAYYDSLVKSFDPSDKVAQRAAWIHIGTMAVALAAVGGFVGNPLWEPIRYLMYLLGLTKNWDDTKTQGEKWLSDLTNPTIAETAMYGLPRLLGFDLSSRVSLDSLLFYRQPIDMTKDSWYSVMGQFATGAIGSMSFDAIAQLHGLATGDKADESWPKWLSKLPAPGFVKDVLKSYDTMANGPTTATGVSTGEPTGLLAALVGSLGIRTREQARPFEQGSAAQHRHQQQVDAEKSALVRRLNASGSFSAASMRAINAWNEAHPEKQNRITAKTLIHARKRQLKTEREIATQNLGAM
jgi:hypothetical protein